MLFRKRLFTSLGVVLLALTLLLFAVQVSGDPDESVRYESAFRLGQGLGAAIILCVPAPFITVLLLLGWRNAVGLRNEARERETERRHQEQLEAVRRTSLREYRRE